MCKQCANAQSGIRAARGSGSAHVTRMTAPEMQTGRGVGPTLRLSWERQAWAQFTSAPGNTSSHPGIRLTRTELYFFEENKTMALSVSKQMWGV